MPCRIILKGDVSERLEAAFGGLSFCRQAGHTELTGTLADQCQLRSLLNWLFDLGIEVVSIHAGSECAHPGCPVIRARSRQAHAAASTTR